FLHLFEPKANAPKNANAKQQVFYQQGQQKPFKKTSHLTQQRVDELLDKINQKGYHFLSDEEKAYLKRAAKEEM
ncbi:MAG: rhomboid family intramembrane serine protease, partial [Bacteroidetes bacterium]